MREPHARKACGATEKKLSVSSPQSRSQFSASFQTFCLTARAFLKRENTDCFAVYGN